MRFTDEPSPSDHETGAVETFVRDVGQVLVPISGSRIPVTLVSISSHSIASWTLYQACRQVLGAQGIVGPLPGGGVGFLYVGPHPSAIDRRGGDLPGRIVRNLAGHLLADLPGRRMDLSLKSVSFFTDELRDAGDLFAAVQGPEASDILCPDLLLPGVLFGTATRPSRAAYPFFSSRAASRAA